MSGASRATRIELRTLAFFVASAILPVLAFAMLGFVAVNAELRQLSQDRLDAAAKSYGLAIFDRLQQVQMQTEQVALHQVKSSAVPPGTVLSDDPRATVRIIADDPAPTASAQTATATRMRLDNVEGVVHPVLVVYVRTGTRAMTLEASAKPGYLWNTDALLPLASRACVHAGERTLNCSVIADAQTGENSLEEPLHAQWDLYLNAAYGTTDWRVSVAQARSTAFASLDAFRWTLPIAAGLAVAIALLLGSILIRRSHAPLRLLTQAAQRISRGDFGQPIRSTARDEYGKLVRTFNRMASHLRDQIALLSGFARIDEMILSHAGVSAAVDALLPQLPRLLRSRAVAVMLKEPDESVAVHLLGGRAASVRSWALPALPEVLASVRELTALNASEAACLFEMMGARANQLWVAPILVRGAARGYILVAPGRFARDVPARIQGIAQRIAVAIGHDDHRLELLRQARYDTLTGLANRTLLRERLEHALAERMRAGGQGAVLFIDLDRFKSVNDSLGHSVGDMLLRQVAARLLAHALPPASVARFGGDEFVIVVPHIDRQEIAAFALQLLDGLRDPVHLQELSYVTQASAGVAIFPDHGTSVDEVLKNADIAMYRAKAGGRARMLVFDESMRYFAADRLRLEERLREALRTDAIAAHFQPKLDRDGRLVGAEALARWSDGNVRIAPSSFIPLAEETGLIVALGQRVLREACRQLRDWRAQGLQLNHVAVNVSMLQLRDPSFVTFVRQCLEEFGLNGDSLELELTESLFAEEATAMAAQLAELQQAGIRIGIDDFGTGFSSMSRLRDYPISTLKIDRSFVCDSHSTQGRQLLRALIDVGHALGLDVVAEGVETNEQFAVLRTLGCDSMQGYLFAPPLPAAEMAAFIRSSVAPLVAQERSAG